MFVRCFLAFLFCFVVSIYQCNSWQSTLADCQQSIQYDTATYNRTNQQKYHHHLLFTLYPLFTIARILIFSTFSSKYVLFLFFWQIFRSLESPAEEQRVSSLRENVIKQREHLINNITVLANIKDLRNFDRAVSLQLEKYELVRKFVYNNNNNKNSSFRTI